MVVAAVQAVVAGAAAEEGIAPAAGSVARGSPGEEGGGFPPAVLAVAGRVCPSRPRGCEGPESCLGKIVPWRSVRRCATFASWTMSKRSWHTTMVTCAYGSDDAARIAGHKSREIEHILGYRGREEMIHRDDLVLVPDTSGEDR